MTLALVLVGAVASIVGGWLSNRWQTTREREARRDEQDALAAAKRAEFQRETLIGFQDALGRLVRATHDILLAADAGARAGTPYSAFAPSAALKDAWTTARFDGLTFLTRVADQAAREAMLPALGLSDQVRISTDRVEGIGRFERFQEAANVATNRAGELLRDLDLM